VISARTLASRHVQLVLSTCFIAWVALVLVLFYAVKEQKPIQDGDIELMRESAQAFVQSPSWLAAADALLNLLAAAALTLAASVIGFRLNPLPYPLSASLVARTEFWLLSIPLGFGVLALVTLALSVFGLLTPLALAALVIAMLWLRPHRILHLLARDANALRAMQLHPLVWLFVAISLLFALLVGLTPVSSTHLRAHETPEHPVCRLLLEKKN